MRRRIAIFRPGAFSWQQTFAALRYPNYRLWFFGQMVSLFGSWMQSTAEGFLVYELTRSPAYLGYVSFCSGIPTWLLMLFGGVVADRVSRRTLLMVTQSWMMLQAFIVAALTFTHRVQPWHIMLLAAGLGAANAFDAPARQAFVLEMVERKDLTNAIALNSIMFNTGTAVGPAAAGVVYALVGPAWCFTINGITFLAIIAALALMRLRPLTPRVRHKSALADLGEGLRYLATQPMIRALIGLVGVASLFGISFNTLMPAWAVNILHGGATTNGLLQSARGVGALLGALTIASLGRFRYKGRLLSLGSLAFPLALLVFSFVRWLPLSLAALLAVGAAMMFLLNLANALVQTLVADELRGRVMSVYSLIFLGVMPLGGLLAGTLAEHLGEPVAVGLGASAVLAVATGAWLFLPRLRALE